MADDSTKNTPPAGTPGNAAKGNAAKSDTATGGSATGGTTGDAPALPDATIEPVAQEAATASSPTRPPLPADYEMPDDYADQDWVTKTKSWVEEHPGLAILAATGIGLLAGRVVTALLPDPEPTLADRVEKKAKVYKKEAAKRRKQYKKEAEAFKKDAEKKAKKYRKSAKKEIASFRKDPEDYIEDVGDSLEDSLQRAAKLLRHSADEAGDTLEDGYERSKDFVDHVSDAVKVALSGVVAAKVDDWVSKARH
ncbi:hypothetical protein RQM47_12505 [Rubrivirga sp. S365]|uniref:YtxH-like protein n=1 Tax=Rubrivirga litoralis TaxID=3075598 RepID=A0ABU3BUF8_9BACT|nr:MULTISPECIES: hypothetical protein [unclassified Rubrivirga]MDT0632918.1 hypothetical protein [Rubrivirga sp. F394]MDT7857466.1 hypothetical protein [Rubrivirga sp. S365]